MKLLGWLLHCSTCSLRKHKPSTLFHNTIKQFVTVKPCHRNITTSTNLGYSDKVNLQVPVYLSFQGLSAVLGKEKWVKYTYFTAWCCFILPLIFATQSLIISLQHINPFRPDPRQQEKFSKGFMKAFEGTVKW